VITMSDHLARSRLSSGSTAVNWGDAVGERYGIAEIVSLTAVPPSSVHHYLRLGLVPPPERTTANRFAYDERHVVALGIVRCMRQRGRTLQEIHDVLPELWSKGRERVGSAVDDYLDQQASPPGARERLVEAAIVEFAGHDYGEVTITAVCARAHAAKGTFYRYFDNKAELFLAAAAAVVEQAIASFARDMETGRAGDAATFAFHLRPGLPVLFELAKSWVHDPGSNAGTAMTLFVGLVEHLGGVLAPTAGRTEQAQRGGLLVVLAVVEVFARLFEAELGRDSGEVGLLGRP
jgi:AcrR family transcriptional regulator